MEKTGTWNDGLLCDLTFSMELRWNLWCESDGRGDGGGAM